MLLGGGIAPLAKIALSEVTPELFTFLRFFLASLILLPLLFKEKVIWNKDILKLIGLSLLPTANVILFAYGVRLTTANVSQALYVVTPVLVFLLSYIFLKEKVSFLKLLGIAIGLAGAFIVIVLPIIEASIFSGNLTGNLLILTAVFTFSAYTILSKRFQKKFTPIQLTIGFCVTTAISMIIISLPSLPYQISQISNLTQQGILSILYISIFGTAILYVLYQYAIKHSSATLASTVLYLQPLSTITWSYFVLGERLTLGFIAGGILSIIGTLIVARSK